jgi:hypothetical protein
LQKLPFPVVLMLCLCSVRLKNNKREEETEREEYWEKYLSAGRCRDKNDSVFAYFLDSPVYFFRFSE